MIVPPSADVDQLYVLVAAEGWGMNGGKPSGAHETLIYRPERTTGVNHYTATWTATLVGKSASMYLVANYEVTGPDLNGGAGVGQPLAVIAVR